MLDLIFISETWLKSEILNKEILPYGFNIYRADRTLERTGGGVLIAIKQGTFISSSKAVSISTNSLEAILPSHSKLLLVCWYRPPDSNDMFDFRSLADNFFSSYEQVIIAGDFNLPNINWMDSNYTCNGALDQEFCDILDNYFMSQNCLLPTRESNILDLLITNHPEQVSILDICGPKEMGMSSDHHVVHLKVLLPVSSTKQPKRLVFHYKWADFEGLRNRLTELDVCSLLSNNEKESTIHDNWPAKKYCIVCGVWIYSD